MQLCSCAPAQSAPTIRPYFPSARGACPRVDLIPQEQAFLNLQKANDFFAILRR